MGSKRLEFRFYEMALPGRNVKSHAMSGSADSYQIQSEARGSHWVAWVLREGSTKPEHSALIIGETQEEAEAKARRWADQQRKG